ncbi:MAG: hypothetical protein NWF14_03200 [Candidatus Bathyarchaeota archaeon]|nr:hypothetical protein [Candidatus Bathyarchaeota archaeon]
MQKVIVTGYQTLKNTRRALGLDENAYLVKPVQAEKIIKTVRRQLAERERENLRKDTCCLRIRRIDTTVRNISYLMVRLGGEGWRRRGFKSVFDTTSVTLF